MNQLKILKQTVDSDKKMVSGLGEVILILFFVHCMINNVMLHKFVTFPCDLIHHYLKLTFLK